MTAGNPKTNPLNANFKRAEFRELWSRINRKCVYGVDFDSNELIRNAVESINAHLHVTPLQYVVQSGEQASEVTDVQVRSGQAFELRDTATERADSSGSRVAYDLVGKIAENVQLTRKTIAHILLGLEPSVFRQFSANPEHFIAQTSRLIAEERATTIIEQLRYDPTEDRHDAGISPPPKPARTFLAPRAS